MPASKFSKSINLALKSIILGVLLFSSLFALSLTILAAQNEVKNNEAGNADLLQGQELFFKGRKMFYNAEASIGVVKEIFNSCSNVFNKLPDDYEKYYWLAQTEFELAEIAEYSKDKKQAAQNFTESGYLIRKALDLNPKSSDANRVLADTIMRLMGYKGTMYMMAQGPQALKILNNATSLDKQNYAVMNSLATYYVSAPAIGGGNADKGIQSLQKALESKEQFDNFISYMWLGQAYWKKKNNNVAIKYFNKALEIYPNSPWAKSWLQEIGQKN